MIAALAAASLIAGPALADGPRGDDHTHTPPAGVTAPYLRDLLPNTYRPLPRVDTRIAHAIVLDGAGHRSTTVTCCCATAASSQWGTA